MSFWAHFEELRRRLIRSVIALVVATMVATLIADRILLFLIRPYGHPLQTLGPTESVVTYLRVSLMAGAIMALPYIVYQVLAFVMPGLTPQEQRWVYFSLPVATALFLTGASFAWFVMMPAALGFLSGFQSEIFTTEWTSDRYIAFVTSLVFWIGLSFETPLVLFLLAKLKVLSWRDLARGWRLAVVISSVIAAMITPTVDPFNMALVMGPLLALYLLSILLTMMA